MASIELQTQGGEVQPRLTFGDAQPLGLGVVSAMAIDNRRDRRQAINEQLGYLRTAFRDLRQSSNPEHEEQVAAIDGRFLQDTKGLKDKRLPYMRGTLVVDWLANADSKDLEQFCTWNVARNREQQVALDAVLPTLQENAAWRFDHLVKIGFFPNVARNLLRSTINDITDIVAIDSFEAGGLRANGFFENKPGRRIAYSNLFDKRTSFEQISRLFYETNVHENTHATGMHNGRGFYHGVYAPLKTGLSFALLEEPFAAQTAMAAFSVNPHDWHTFLIESHPAAPYHKEREFLGLTADYGLYPIESDHISAAYFTPKSDPRNYRRDLERKLRCNLAGFFPEYGDAALNVLAATYGGVQRYYRPTLMNGWLNKIYSQLGMNKVIMDIELKDLPAFELVPVAASSAGGEP